MDDDRNYNEARRALEYRHYTLSDVREASAQKLFSVVSTFAGGGGSSTGYRLAGGDVLAVNEFVPAAIDTYRQNFPDTFIDTDDIRKITGRKGKQGVIDWFASFGVAEGELDILDGSPPCATFSKALGVRNDDDEKHLEKGKKYSDTSQDRVGMLVHDYVYLANCIQPKVCVLENVPEIRKSSVFSDALTRLRRGGYFVKFKVLAAHHHGVPQRRERVFAIGVRKDICNLIGIVDEDDILTLFPKGSSFHPSLHDAIGTMKHDEQDLREIALIRQEIRKGAAYEVIRAIPKNPPRPSRLHEHHKGFKNFYFSIYRGAWGEPAPTLTASGNGLGAGQGSCIQMKTGHSRCGS
jgi:DNA (cytosine-5)-methyltransferase 1